MEIPTATYRIQFNPDFGFRRAANTVAYLADLGISHLYASPIFKARKDSRHGYDGVDPNALNPELGSSADFERLITELHRHGMGWLQDIVPNHMAFDFDNRMLMDVLEYGPSSRYHHFFDIVWDHPDETMQNRLLAPFLGDRYTECLQKAQIQLCYDDSGFGVTYFNFRLPLRIDSYPEVLGRNVAKIKAALGEEHPDIVRFSDILDGLESLLLQLDLDLVRFIKQTLWDLYSNNPVIKEFIDASLKEYNGVAGDMDSLRLLDQLLSRQIFRLCHWKLACEEINYRRFFTINELISLRQEKQAVFEHTHSLLTGLTQQGIVTGVRIDHIDGLSAPTAYLQALRNRLGDVYLLVEKILASGEALPRMWPVQGTTGYDVADKINAVFVQQENAEPFTAIYSRFSGQETSFEQVVCTAKRYILESQLAGDLDNLARGMKKIAVRKRFADDVTLRGITQALTEILVRFPVYCTYIDAEGARPADRRFIQAAADLSVTQAPHLQYELEFIRKLLLQEFDSNLSDGDLEIAELCRRSIAKFQQLTPSLMAKGFEDTALYVYNRLISLNEVGGDPGRFGCSVVQFHDFVGKRAQSWPHAMNSTATHDSKRGEDVRARINVLSELPQEWERNLNLWHELNHAQKERINDFEIPDNNEEYFLYQTLLGAYRPAEQEISSFTERVKAYVVKAAREAEIHTSWLQPDEQYEAALIGFVERILHPSPHNDFLKRFRPFFNRIAHYGIFNGLSQTLIKMTAPGVPDFYQGSELLDLNLVDPDNRRPVAFERRRGYLADISKRMTEKPLTLISELLDSKSDGRIKLFLILLALQTRKDHAALFQKGAYIPLKAAGAYEDHIIAFARSFENTWALTIVPRLLTRLITANENPLGELVWRDTAVLMPERSPRCWRNIFTRERFVTDQTLAVAALLNHFPVALLIGKEDE
jgi:(1->4)-alpha-D-glucan 1-alpha-D-glucosylmutase